jgi:4-amino-4-deoxy-L-arabinose transferase-like glycosyltransferase
VRKLQHPDEGRYAEIAREMAASGDWVTPRLNGLKYFEKPPMQYWATAAAFNAFGVTNGRRAWYPRWRACSPSRLSE